MPDALSNEQKLARINAFDAKPAGGLLHGLLMRVGPNPLFANAYSRIGPMIDPYVSRVREGELMRALYGLPGMVLHSTGAKSGQPRSNPLLYARDGDDFIVVGTNFGQKKHPGWTANLRAHSAAAVEAAGVTIPVTAEQITGEEWDLLFARLTEVYPGYARYLDRRGPELVPRLFRLIPGV